MMNGQTAVRRRSVEAWQRSGAVCLLVLFVLLLSTPELFAQESYREFEQGLNLSDSQKAQVEEIKKKYMDEWTELKNESARKRLELRDLGRSRPEERERSEKLQRDLDQLEASKLSLFRRYRGEVSSIFNQDQKDRFNRFMDSRENRRPMNRFRYR